MERPVLAPIVTSDNRSSQKLRQLHVICATIRLRGTVISTFPIGLNLRRNLRARQLA